MPARFAPWVAAALALAGCAVPKHGGRSPDALMLVGFSVARATYAEGLLPAFKETRSGPPLRVRESYEGSGAQVRAILAGLPADVAALTLAPEVERLVKAGLVSPDWDQGRFGGSPASSTVVLAVRPGNPKGIRDWQDLTREDVRVLMASPDTSGSAQWNVAAIYGAVKLQGGSDHDAYTLMRSIRRRVRVYGKSGRESMQQFLSGTGDVLVAWENEALQRMADGESLELVYPTRTIRMDPPVAAVQPKGGNPSKQATAFVTFLETPAAQRQYAAFHMRPRDPEVAKEFGSLFPPVPGLFTIDEIGGWEEVQSKLFGDNGLWAMAVK